MACRGPALDPERQLLEDARRAAEERDADGVLACLAGSFQGDGGLGKSEAGAELRRYFALYKSVEIDLVDIVIERPAEGRRATFRAAFSGKPKDIGGLAGMLPEASQFRFEVSLAEEGGSFKIARASWKQIERP